MGGYQIPFQFKTDGLSDLEKVHKIIEEVGKKTNASAGDLRIFDAILKQTAASGGNLSKEMAAIAKGGPEVSKGLQELAKQGLAAHGAMLGLATGVKGVGESQKGAAAASDQFATSILRISTASGAVSGQVAGLTRGVAGLTGGLSSMVNPATIAAAAVVGLATAGTSLVREYAAASRETEKFAERLGLSIGKARQLEQVGAIAGVNVRSLEAAARLLGTALDDSGGAGRKAADALRRLGVDTVSVTDGSREMGLVLSEVIEKLSKIKDASERAHIANQILGRGSKEILPLIAEYDELKDKLHSLGIEYDENVLKKAAAGDKAFRELGMSWQYFKDKIAQRLEPIVIPVIFRLTSMAGKLDSFTNPASLANGVVSAIAAMREQFGPASISGFQPGTPTVPAGMFTPDAAGARGFGARQAATEEGLKSQIKAIEAANAQLAQKASSDTIPAENRRRAQAEFDANKAKIDALQAQIDKTKELAKLQEQLPELRKALARERLNFLAEGSPTARAALEGTFAVKDAPTADLRSGNAALGTQRLQKAAQEELDKFLKENAKVLKDDAPKFKRSIGLTGSDGVTPIAQEDKRLTAEIAAMKKVISESDQATTARINDQSGALRAKADQQAKIVALMAGPGGELQALRIGLQLRMDAAAAELALKQRHSDLFDVEKARIDYEKEAERANYDFQLASLEKVKREKDAFKQDTVRFFNDLVSGNGSGAVKSIGKNLLDQVVGNAAGLGFDSFKKTISGATSGIDTSKGVGKLFAGTILDNKGSSSVPVKLDLSNQYLQEIRDNTAAGAIKSGGGVAGAAGGKYGNIFGGATRNPFIYNFGGPGAATGGFAADGMPAFGGASTANTLGIASLSMGQSQATFLGLSKSALGKGIGYAGAAAGGIMGAVDGFGHGGARGATEGVGSLAGAAGSIMMLAGVSGPAAPILAGVGLALGVITSLMGDPKANRQHQIEKELGNSRYFAPMSLRANMDTSGNYTDYGQDGMIRQSPFRGIPEVTQPYQWYKNGQYQQFPGRTLSPFQDPNVPLPGAVPGLPNPLQGGPTWRQGPNGVTNYNLTIQALDAKNIKDRAGDIADAMHHAIQSGRAQGFMEAHREASSR